MARTISVLAVLMMLARPAQAHTTEEIEQWEADWEQRFNELIPETFTISSLQNLLPLMEEKADFQSRHYCHYHDCAPRVRTSHSSTYRGIGSNVEQWRSLVEQYFDPGEADRALCLMKYESGGNPNAKNPRSTARGLMQILASLWAPHFGVSYDDLYDPVINISLAAQIQNTSGGWYHWSPYKRGLCR